VGLPKDGLAYNNVHSMLEDRQGNLWFSARAAGGDEEGGVSQYDGQEFKNFTTKDGLADNSVKTMLEDQNENLWFGTEGGVSRYDGQEFKNFTTKDGLVDNRVNKMLEDRQENLWFGTEGGVSRYDGQEFKNFTTKDGLAHNTVTAMLEDRQGHLWFAIGGAGICRYDGRVFQRLTRHDGLVHDVVYGIFQDGRGDIWIATADGVTRYRSRRTPPAIRLKEVIADRRYGPAGEVQLPISQKLLAFEFQGYSWTTRVDGMVYVYRLEGYDADWQTTHERRVTYQDLELGEYTFQVQAVDRDLNYSEPATVQVTVQPDPRIEALTQALGGPTGEFVGNSPALRQIQGHLREVAQTDLTVLILGETGTGKGLAARTVHGLSAQKAGPFVQLNCGAIPESLVESELFGHEKGAFTGAVARKVGKVELAAGGTLFLDEIGDLAPDAQAKLLQVLEERTFARVGGVETLQAEMRVIAATNRDLEGMVEAGQFREDLYFRLQVFPVRLPPLRDRREDLALLAPYFMASMAAHLKKEVTQLTPEALVALQTYDWPGNVRELEHVIKRAVVVCPGAAIRLQDIALGYGKTAEGRTEERVTLEEHERRYILAVLEQTGWVVGGEQGAAAILGLAASTLRFRMKKLGLQRP
jgi:DNA-binding NtrC family response regulator